MTGIDKSIKDPEIISYIEKEDYADAAKLLIIKQKESWSTLASGIKSLSLIQSKKIQFDNFSFEIQYNPGRYNSTSAAVDEKSINERKCFLCTDNIPKEQKGIIINNYILLANPFPIFPEHFTISSIRHTDQRIAGSFRDLLYFSEILSKHYSVFYNGPLCGASAPDHLHFQAGNKFIMPIDTEYDTMKSKYSEVLAVNKAYKVYGMDDGLRKIISIESRYKEQVEEVFQSFYQKFAQHFSMIEPMMNILSSYEKESGWRIIIFLRIKHRPEEFFIKGGGKLLYSPAATDMGGLCITPLEKDYNRFNAGLLTKIFKEINITAELFKTIKDEIKTALR